MAEDVLSPLLDQFLACAQDALTNPVNRAMIMPGADIVEDDCCEGGGQLHVRVISIVGVSGLGNAATQPCVPLYQVRCGIGTRRCAHTVSDAGVPPSPAEMTADAKSIIQDRADIMEALNCCIAPLIGDRMDLGALHVEDWLPTPVLGGCIGCEVTFTFKQNLCTPCP